MGILAGMYNVTPLHFASLSGLLTALLVGHVCSEVSIYWSSVWMIMRWYLLFSDGQLIWALFCLIPVPACAAMGS